MLALAIIACALWEWDTGWPPMCQWSRCVKSGNCIREHVASLGVIPVRRGALFMLLILLYRQAGETEIYSL